MRMSILQESRHTSPERSTSQIWWANRWKYSVVSTILRPPEPSLSLCWEDQGTVWDPELGPRATTLKGKIFGVAPSDVLLL